MKLTFNNGIHRATLLAVSTVDTLGHVDIISGRATASILTFFGLDGNSLGGADGFAKLAGDTAFFTSRIAAQGVLTAEAR